MAWLLRSFALIGLLVPTASAQPFEIVPTPNPSPDWNLFRGVGGTSDANVWAVGDMRAGVLRHLLFHWDGAGWTEAPAPHVNNDDHILFGVTAAAPDAAWAGGLYSGTGSLASGYILRWNGSEWTLDFNRPGWPIADLHAVGANDVWAVGGTNDVRPTPALALHWDGSGWTRIDPPVVGNRDHWLEAVHASAPDNVWAVGYYRTLVPAGRFPYVVRWDGSAWQEVPMPGAGILSLIAVITFGPDDTWVTLDAENTWHWDGSGWTEYPVSIGSFAGRASNDIYGFSGDDVYHWDGQAWTPVQTLTGLSSPSFRNSAIALPDGAVWAVGRTIEPDGRFRTLAVRKPASATGAEPGVPTSALALSAPWPNPSRGGARFTLALVDAQPLTVALYDALGRRVATLHEGALAAGAHAFAIDGASLPSGAYFLRVTGPGVSAVRAVSLVR
ncbi:MAG TPA: T9SS type A sorting domain-containing protein [Rubricoccaceae bacterium]|nr:T9SS type A sorting domain-containing protein [Rubricoccaceae bacterium]